jgi:alkylation response protein AidB-like acyl-CoA dehydrogenase
LGFRKELPMSVEHVLVESARTLAKELAPRSAEIESARQIPADLCARMAQAGFFRMFLVERLGGLEVSPAVAAQVYEALAEGEPVALTFSRDLRLATTHALQEAVTVVDAMYSLAGGTSVYQASPLQRHFRDVHVAAQHMMVSTGTLETVGRLLLGLETDTSGF